MTTPKKPIILCVDDEKIVLNSLKTELKNSLGDKYAIEIAESAKDALDLFIELLSDGYDIIMVISDYIMPEMKGDEFLIAINKISTEVIKILLTGQADLEGVTNIINHARLYRYIAKPWEIKDLILTVEEGIKSFYAERQVREQNMQLANLNLVLEKKVEERTKELQQKNENIQASINYARRIQQALLPQTEEIEKFFPNYFIYYRPKDVVSGDLYWFHQENDIVFIAAIDCTGHGVPGAFVSVIAHSLITQIIVDKHIVLPHLVLNEMHKGVKKALRQDENQNKDGMDIALCRIDMQSRNLYYAGAMNSLYLVQQGQLLDIKADRCPIGGEMNVILKNGYHLHEILLDKPTNIYLFTDGYRDQFGGNGEKPAKFLSKQFHQLLIDIEQQAMKTQGNIIADTMTKWIGKYKQMDDMLIIGIHL